MKQLAALVLALASGTGCYAQAYGTTGYSSSGYVAVNYSTPPPAVVETNVYYEDRPGHVYINGRYNYVGNQWVWQDGYWETERPGYVYVQGYWHGNRWYDGRWEPHRRGYTYTGGYWNNTGRGHVWVNGTWERDRPGHTYNRGYWSNNGGTRTYVRGGWATGGSVRGTVNHGGHHNGAGSAPGGVRVRDHRR